MIVLLLQQIGLPDCGIHIELHLGMEAVEKIPSINPPNAEPSPDVGLTPILPYSKTRIVRKDIPEPIEPDPFAFVRRRCMAQPSPLSLGVFMSPSVAISLGKSRPGSGNIAHHRSPRATRAPRALQCPIPSCRKKLAGSRELYSHWESHHMGMVDTAMSETHVAEGTFNSS